MDGWTGIWAMQGREASVNEGRGAQGAKQINAG